LTLKSPWVYLCALHKNLILNELTKKIQILILFSVSSCILFSQTYLDDEQMNFFEFTILFILATLSMLILLASNDLLTFYLSIEFQSLSLYVLAALPRHSEFSTEAGLKYFLLGAFSSGLLLFASSIIYGISGQTSFDDIALLSSNLSSTNKELYEGLNIAFIFLFVGILFKMTAVPFHMWAPDVYEGAPTNVTAFFSIVVKTALVGFLAKNLSTSFYDFSATWKGVLLFSSGISMIVGALGALAQSKIKRLLVYSGIGHSAFILLGLCTQSIEGQESSFLYIFLYVIMSINVFAFLLSLQNIGKKSRIRYISDLRGLSLTQPVLAAAFSLTMFSMAGIPPLAGFLSKLSIIFSALSTSLYVNSIIAILASIISCFFYIRCIKIIYFEKKQEWMSVLGITQETALIFACTSTFLIFPMLDVSFFMYLSKDTALDFPI